MIYGIPYKGSKNRLAERILRELPKAGTLYDLFAGGMAVTHAAMASNKYKRIVANDINGEMGELFENALNGRYETDEAWVSRADFLMFKDCNPYIKFAWSFGFNGETYLYSREVEALKKAMHKVVFSKSPIGRKLALRGVSEELKKIEDEKRKLRGYLVELCDECEVECVRRKDGTPDTGKIKKALKGAVEEKVLDYMRDALRRSGRTQADVDRFLGNQMSSHYFGKSQFALPTVEHYRKMQEIIPGLTKDWGALKESLESLGSGMVHLESFSNTERIKSLQYAQGKEKLERLVGSYKDVEIEQDSVVYCDPPYINTTGYSCEFDHEDFYKWLESLTVPVFISEYWMPEDRFICVKEFEHTQSFSGNGAKKVVERLFVPVGQYKENLKLF